jgi:hypothetical protein
MPQHYEYPGEGGPRLVDDTGTRIALGALSVATSIVLVTVGYLFGRNDPDGAPR